MASTSTQEQPMLIILEGNISAGKTTLAKQLAGHLNAKVFLEPTLSNPYLERFYAEPRKYGLLMQLWLLRQRFRMYISAVKYVLEKEKSVILDRSVFSDCVFADKNVADGNITQAGYKAYNDLRSALLADLPVPHVTLYLDVAPETCYDRLHNVRGRACESGIPLAYLAGLHECYLAFLVRMAACGSRVLRRSWDSFGDAQDVAAELLACSVTCWGDNLSTHVLYDSAALLRRMRLKHRICPATGEVFDEELDLATPQRTAASRRDSGDDHDSDGHDDDDDDDGDALFSSDAMCEEHRRECGVAAEATATHS